MSDWLTDLLIILGSVLAGVGLGLVDWRLALVWLGLLCMVAGAARLPGRGKG